MTIHDMIVELADGGNVYAQAFLRETTLMSEGDWFYVYSFKPSSQFDPSTEFRFEISERHWARGRGFVYHFTIWENGQPYSPPFILGSSEFATIPRILVDFVNYTNNILGLVRADKWEIENA